MEIKVCIGSACHLKGAYAVVKEFQRIIAERNLEDYITLKGSFCLNHCTEAVSTQVNNEAIISMDVSNVRNLIDKIVEDNKWNI